MNIGNIANATRIFTAPPGVSEKECAPLAVRDGHDGRIPTMTSAWYPTPEELALLQNGAPVLLTICGNVHPPVRLEVL